MRKGIIFFGLTELSIGVVTLLAIGRSLWASGSTKPLNVLIFVIVSSLISAWLGAGVLLRKPYARNLLVFFAGWIILSKILVFAKIIMLNHALETTIPTQLKNMTSIFYHLAVVLYFYHPRVKMEFER